MCTKVVGMVLLFQTNHIQQYFTKHQFVLVNKSTKWCFVKYCWMWFFLKIRLSCGNSQVKHPLSALWNCCKIFLVTKIFLFDCCRMHVSQFEQPRNRTPLMEDDTQWTYYTTNTSMEDGLSTLVFIIPPRSLLVPSSASTNAVDFYNTLLYNI